MNQSIKINLTKLTGASLVNLQGKTATKQCLVIPIENSGLFVGEKGVYLNCSAFELHEPKYGQTHLVKLSQEKEVWESMSDEERNALPILGGIKQLVAVAMQPTETMTPVPGEGEDLPF